MGTTTSAIIVIAGGADAVNTLTSGSAGGGPIGAVGQTLSTAGAAAQTVGTITGASSTGVHITNGLGLAGNVLTGLQITLDQNNGQTIKAGDLLTVGVGIPVGMALAVGVIGPGSVLVPLAAFAGFVGTTMNLAGFTMDDIFKMFPPGNRELSFGEKQALERYMKNALPLSYEYGNEVPNFPITQSCNRAYNEARLQVTPSDPLVLDLDGDGLEAVGINTSSPILFDHDANGVKTATGWINSDDGIVVRDLNGNGIIDSGRELFGENTVLLNGNLASNGYAALADLDSNSDGKIDSSDLAYSELRIWQDANQDGSSQTFELKSLSELGISSIASIGTASNVDLGNGNTQPWISSFTRTNGTSGGSGTAELSGSLLLASNGFYREFTDDPEISQQAKSLPQMAGSGWLRDLREAMSLGSDKSEALEDSVAEFATASTRDAQFALIDQLLSDWGGTSGRMVSSIHKYNMTLQNGRYVTTDLTSEIQGAIVLTLHAPGMDMLVNDPILHNRWIPTTAGAEFYRRLNVLEAFNGTKFIEMAPLPDNSVPGASQSTPSSGGQAASAIQVVGSLNQTQVNLINQAYDALVESVYSALAVQTRLKVYTNSIELEVSSNSIRFNSVPLSDLLDSRRSVDERNAFIDLVELNRYTQNTLRSVDFDAMSKLRTWIDALPSSSPLRDEFDELYVFSGTGSNGSEVQGTAKNDLFFGVVGGGNFAGGIGDDSMLGSSGSDTLLGGEGDDTIDGGAGNDILSGGHHNSMNGWYNGLGNDTYLFGRGDGQDTMSDFDTTENNFDRIIFKSGVLPADVKVRRAGDALVLSIVGTSDQIHIKDYFIGDGDGGWAIESIQFADVAGISWTTAEVKAKALLGTDDPDELTGYSTNDTINGDLGDDKIDGRDGNDTLNGEGGHDVLKGGFGQDSLDGGDGNDVLWGLADNDALTGGAGNDELHGGGGDDVMDGYTGNDIMSGDQRDTFNGVYWGYGNDTYLFGRGDGQDEIWDPDTTLGNLDKIIFKAGVAPSDVRVLREGDSLILRINGTSDQLRVEKYFGDDGTNGWQVEEVRFTDSPATVWTVANVKAMALTGGEEADIITGFASDDVLLGNGGNDTLTGGFGNDTLNGGDGNDVLWGLADNDTLLGGASDDELHGGGGDDVMDGGTGNDIMSGDQRNTFHGVYWGFGNDTYLFGRGDGWDEVWDPDTTPGNLDKIIFKTGVAPSDVLFVRDGTGLVLKIKDTNDQIRIEKYFDTQNGADWKVEEIRFVDAPSIVWDAAEIDNKLYAGNTPIAASAIPAQEIAKAASWSFAVPAGTFTDADAGNGDVLTLSASLADGNALPAWLSFDSATQMFSGTPGASDIGNLNLNVVATDRAGNTAQMQWTVEIVEQLGINISGAGTLQGTAYNDTLRANAAGVTLLGGAGNDNLSTLYSGANYGHTYVGGLGNDVTSGSYAGDTYRFNRGDGHDTIRDDVRDYPGSDATNAYTQNPLNPSYRDVLELGPGISAADVTLSKAGQDLVFTINNDGGSIRVQNWFDSIFNRIERVTLTDGSVWALSDIDAAMADGAPVSGSQLQQAGLVLSGTGTLQGASTDDVLTATGAQTTLLGGAGNDALVAANGAAVWDLTFEGGTGNDTITGSYARDLYKFSRGDGDDVITDDVRSYPGSTAPNNFAADPTRSDYQDVLQLGATIVPEDVTLTRDGQDLVFSLNNAGGSVRVKNWFESIYTRIEKVTFSDGRAWAVDDIQAATVGGGAVLGSAIGIAGVTLSGSGTLQGTANNDILRANGAAVTLLGGAGNDNLSTIFSGSNYGHTYEGGLGDDTISGSYAGDTFRFNRGDGHDTVRDDVRDYPGSDATNGYSQNPENPAYRDVLQLGAGIAAADLTLTRNGQDLVFTVNNGGGSITFKNWFESVFMRMERVNFDSGMSWTMGDIDTAMTGNNSISGSAVAGSGLTIVGSGTLQGGPLDDTLTANAANATLLGGGGNDTLIAMATSAVWDLTFEGGAGNDTITGSYARDLFKFNRGDGNDVISDDVRTYPGTTATTYYTADPSRSDYQDVLQFGTGIDPDDLTMTRDGLDLVFTVDNSGGSVRVSNWFESIFTRVEKVTFTDGTVWSVNAIQLAMANGGTVAGSVMASMGVTLTGSGTLQGTANNDFLTANAGYTQMLGGAGDDHLSTLFGPAIWDLTFEGGAGNDTIKGSFARDFYKFGRGDGSDTISDNVAEYGPDAVTHFRNNPGDVTYHDKITFGADISADQLWLRQLGNDLEVSVIGTSDKITVKDWYLDDMHRIEILALSNGQKLLDSQVQNLVQAMAAFSPPAAGQTTLPTSYATTLNPTIAANWQ